MTQHLLIADDHGDIQQNLSRNIQEAFPDWQISLAETCQKAYDVINFQKTTNPVDFLILDLTFKVYDSNAVLQQGRHLLRRLKEEKSDIKVLVYTEHNELIHIAPIIKNYEPWAYIIKSITSTDEVVLALKNVLKGRKFYSHDAHLALKRKAIYEFKLSDFDLQIIDALPAMNSMEDWKSHVFEGKNPPHYKTIRKHINELHVKFGVDNDKKLVLKLRDLGILTNQSIWE